MTTRSRRRRSPARVAKAGGVAGPVSPVWRSVSECPLPDHPHRGGVLPGDRGARPAERPRSGADGRSDRILAGSGRLRGEVRAGPRADAGGHGRRDARLPDRDPRGEARRGRGRGRPRRFDRLRDPGRQEEDERQAYRGPGAALQSRAGRLPRRVGASVGPSPPAHSNAEGDGWGRRKPRPGPARGRARGWETEWPGPPSISAPGRSTCLRRSSCR